MKNVLRYPDMCKIQSAISDLFYNSIPMEIVIPVDDLELMHRLNDEFYYLMNPDGEAPVDVPKEIRIRIINMDFIYQYRGKENENPQ